MFTDQNTTNVAPNAQTAYKVAPHELNPELARIAVNQSGHSLARMPQVAGRAHSVPPGTVGAVGENADADRAQPAAVSVNGNRAAGVIDLQNSLVEQDAAANQGSGQHANNHRAVGDTNAHGAVIATSPPASRYTPS